MYGKEVMNQKVTNTTINLNLGDLSAGMYFVNLIYDNYTKVEKLIKK